MLRIVGRVVMPTLASLLVAGAVYAQSGKPAAAVAPVAALGSVPVSQQVIMLNSLFSAFSSNYQLISMEEYSRAEEAAFSELDLDQCTVEQCIRKIQELLQVERLVTLQLIKEGELTQLSLTMTRLDDRIVRSDVCEDCSTSELLTNIRALASAVMIADLSGKDQQQQQAGRAGVLTLIGQESDDKLSIDMQPTPLLKGARYVLPSGQHTVVVERLGYRRYEETLEVVAGSVSPISLVDVLEPITGTLTIADAPSGSTYSLSGGLYKPTSRQGPLPLREQPLPVGSYEITLFLPGVPDQSYTVTVDAGQTVSLSAADTRRDELREGRRGSAWWVFSGAALFAVAGYVYATEAERIKADSADKVDTANNALSDVGYSALKEEAQGDLDEAAQVKEYSDASYIIAAGLGAWWAWLYWGEPALDYDPVAWHTSLQPQAQGLALTFTRRW